MESKKRHEERQAKAAELRERFRQEKAEKVKDLTKKVVEVRLFKDKMEEQKRDYLDRKLQEAEEKRKLQLKLKVKKAHEEETKVRVVRSLIAFRGCHDIKKLWRYTGNGKLFVS